MERVADCAWILSYFQSHLAAKKCTQEKVCSMSLVRKVRNSLLFILTFATATYKHIFLALFYNVSDCHHLKTRTVIHISLLQIPQNTKVTGHTVKKKKNMRKNPCCFTGWHHLWKKSWNISPTISLTLKSLFLLPNLYLTILNFHIKYTDWHFLCVISFYLW